MKKFFSVGVFFMAIVRRKIFLPEKFRANIIFRIEINFFDFLRNLLDVSRQKMNVVPDEVRRSCKTRHQLCENSSVAMIEKNIVTVTIFFEMIRQVMRADLQKVGESINAAAGFRYDVQFAETDAGTSGNI